MVVGEKQGKGQEGMAEGTRGGNWEGIGGMDGEKSRASRESEMRRKGQGTSTSGIGTSVKYGSEV